MRELTLRVEDPNIRINGHVFTLRLTDLELFTRVQALYERYERIAAEERDAETVLAAAGEAAALLEEALGSGAVGVIAGGRPVSLALAVEWLGALAKEAAEHYAELALRDGDEAGVP
jgi:hypothetical protein